MVTSIKVRYHRQSNSLYIGIKAGLSKTHGNDFIFCDNDLLSFGYDLLTCVNVLVSFGNNLLTFGDGLLSCGNKITK